MALKATKQRVRKYAGVEMHAHHTADSWLVSPNYMGSLGSLGVALKAQALL